ncbi:hypothetical protein WA016_01198 [Myxococcus stipitatus]
MLVQYDPNIIQTHAESLYEQAKGVVVRGGLAGFAVGAFIGYAVGGSEGGSTLAVIGGALLAIIGVAMARSRALTLQLQAQMALCQVAIEANTRRATGAAVAPVGPPAEPPQLFQAG